MATEDQIFVLTELAEDLQPRRVERGFADRLDPSKLKAVDVSLLKQNMDRFVTQLREMLGKDVEEVGAFRIEEVTVSACITGEGQVCLLGSGGKVGLQAGLTLRLKRAKT